MTFFLIIFGTIFVLAPIASAIASRISRDPSVMPTVDHAEIGRLRDEVERLSTEVARLQEEQSFMVKLLNEGDRKKLDHAREHVE